MRTLCFSFPSRKQNDAIKNAVVALQKFDDSLQVNITDYPLASELEIRAAYDTAAFQTIKAICKDNNGVIYPR